MEVKCRRDQVNQRRFVADFSLAKEFRRRDVTAPAMRLDATPVIDSLKNMLAIFRDLQFNYDQTPVVTQRQQVNWTRAGRAAVRGAKLRVQRGDNQAGIELGYVAPQH